MFKLLEFIQMLEINLNNREMSNRENPESTPVYDQSNKRDCIHIIEY